MLLADKRELQNNLKVSLLQIEEKELNFYTNNCMTVGTQAALLSGFGFTAIIEVDLFKFQTAAHLDRTVLKTCWFAVTVIAMILEICSLVKAMQLSILGPGLALRGPEGSMARALAVMRVEYQKVHGLFYGGLVAFLVSVALYAWAFFKEVGQGSLSAMVTILVVTSAIYIVNDSKILYHRLKLPASHAHGIAWEDVPIGAAPPAAAEGKLRRHSPAPGGGHSLIGPPQPKVFISRRNDPARGAGVVEHHARPSHSRPRLPRLSLRSSRQSRQSGYAQYASAVAGGGPVHLSSPPGSAPSPASHKIRRDGSCDAPTSHARSPSPVPVRPLSPCSQLPLSRPLPLAGSSSPLAGPRLLSPTSSATGSPIISPPSVVPPASPNLTPPLVRRCLGPTKSPLLSPRAMPGDRDRRESWPSLARDAVARDAGRAAPPGGRASLLEHNPAPRRRSCSMPTTQSCGPDDAAPDDLLHPIGGSGWAGNLFESLWGQFQPKEAAERSGREEDEAEAARSRKVCRGGPCYPHTAAGGAAGAPAPSSPTSGVGLFTIQCKERGGASRSVTWSMPGEGSLLDVRNHAALSFGCQQEALVLMRDRREFTTEQLRTRIHIYASRVTAGAPASADRAPTLELEATVVQP